MSAGATTGHRASPAKLFLEFLLSRAGSAVLSLATVVVVTRATPLATAGTFIAATGYATLLFSFLDLGTGPGLVRQAARGARDHHITVYVWTRALLTAIVVVIGAVGVLLLFPAGTRLAGFVSLVYVGASLYGALGPIGQVLGDARTFRILTLAQGAAVLAGVVAVVVLVDEPSAELLVAAYSVAAAGASAFAIVSLRRVMVPIAPAQLGPEVVRNLRSIAMLGLATGAGSIYLRIDQTLVLRFLGGGPAAFYGLAARIVTQARLVPATLQFAIGGFLAARHQREGGLLASDARLLTRVAAFGGVGLALGLIAVSDAAVHVLAGARYTDAIAPTVILAVAMVSTCFNYVIGTSAIMAGKDRMYLVATLSAATFNIVANVILIPRHGLLVAAVIATTTELLALLVIRSALDSSTGALSGRVLIGSVAIAAAAGGLKLAAVDASLALNVAVSAALIIAGALCAALAYRALKALPTPDDPAGAPAAGTTRPDGAVTA